MKFLAKFEVLYSIELCSICDDSLFSDFARYEEIFLVFLNYEDNLILSAWPGNSLG